MSGLRLKGLVSRQLRPELGPRGRLSATNRLLVVTIVLALTVAILETEAELRHGHNAVFLVVNLVFGVVFAAEYLARLWIADADDPGRPIASRLRFVFSLAASSIWSRSPRR